MFGGGKIEEKNSSPLFVALGLSLLSIAHFGYWCLPYLETGFLIVFISIIA